MKVLKYNFYTNKGYMDNMDNILETLKSHITDFLKIAVDSEAYEITKNLDTSIDNKEKIILCCEYSGKTYHFNIYFENNEYSEFSLSINKNWDRECNISSLACTIHELAMVQNLVEFVNDKINNS